MNRIIVIISILFICQINCYAGEKEDFKNRFLFMGETEGDQSVWLDKHTIKQDNFGIANINIINRFVRGGNTYLYMKSVVPNGDPSFSVTNAYFDCKKLRMKRNSKALYDNNITEYYVEYFDDKWTQLREKDPSDKLFIQGVCK